MIDKLEYSEDNHGKIVREKKKPEHTGFMEYNWKDTFGNHGQRRGRRAYIEQRRMLMAVRGTSLHVKAKNSE